MGGKWLEIVRDIAPAVSRVALLFNPQTSPGGGSYYSKPIEAAASALGIRPIAMPVHGVGEMETAVKSFTRDPNGGLVVLSDTFNVVNRKLIIGLAFAEPLYMLIAYCGVQNRRTCQSSNQPNST